MNVFEPAVSSGSMYVSPWKICELTMSMDVAQLSDAEIDDAPEIPTDVQTFVVDTDVDWRQWNEIKAFTPDVTVTAGPAVPAPPDRVDV